MLIYLALVYVLLSETGWLFMHYGVISFLAVFSALLAFVIALIWSEARSEKKGTSHVIVASRTRRLPHCADTPCAQRPPRRDAHSGTRMGLGDTVQHH